MLRQSVVMHGEKERMALTDFTEDCQVPWSDDSMELYLLGFSDTITRIHMTWIKSLKVLNAVNKSCGQQNHQLIIHPLCDKHCGELEKAILHFFPIINFLVCYGK